MRLLLMRRADLEVLLDPPTPPPGYSMRPSDNADADGLAAVLASAFDPSWSTVRVLEELLDAPDVVRSFVVVATEVPVGTASARLVPERFPGAGYLHWVAVHPSHRGRRLGAMLSLAVLRHFRGIGCASAVLETDPERLPANRTYLNLGFRPVPLEPRHRPLWRGILASLGEPPMLDLPRRSSRARPPPTR